MSGFVRPSYFNAPSAFEIWVSRINVYIFFTLVSLILSAPIITDIITKFANPNPKIAKQICLKSEDDGMNLTMNSLDFKEYSYVRELSNNWLPELPQESFNIHILYYRDDFIGDFDLNIIINLPKTKDSYFTEQENWSRLDSSSNDFYKFQYHTFEI